MRKDYRGTFTPVTALPKKTSPEFKRTLLNFVTPTNQGVTIGAVNMEDLIIFPKSFFVVQKFLNERRGSLMRPQVENNLGRFIFLYGLHCDSV